MSAVKAPQRMNPRGEAAPGVQSHLPQLESSPARAVPSDPGGGGGAAPQTGSTHPPGPPPGFNPPRAPRPARPPPPGGGGPPAAPQSVITQPPGPTPGVLPTRGPPAGRTPLSLTATSPRLVWTPAPGCPSLPPARPLGKGGHPRLASRPEPRCPLTPGKHLSLRSPGAGATPSARAFPQGSPSAPSSAPRSPV